MYKVHSRLLVIIKNLVRQKASITARLYFCNFTVPCLYIVLVRFSFHANSTANNVFAIYYFVVNTVVAEDEFAFMRE